MADNNNNLNITIQIRDLATKKLEKLKQSMQGVDAVAQGAAKQLTKYAKANRTSLEKSVKENDRLTQDSAKKRIKASEVNASNLNQFLKQGDKDTLKSSDKRIKAHEVNASNLNQFLKQSDKDTLKSSEATAKRKEANHQSLLRSMSHQNELFTDKSKKEAIKRTKAEKEALANRKIAEKKAREETRQQQKNARYTERQFKKDENEAARQKKLEDREKERRSVQKTDADFTQFNKTLFTTAAFIGAFTKLYQGFGNKLQEGAQLDRLQTQFKRVFGSVGIGQQISSFTTTAVDEVAAMQAALEMGNLGVAKSSEDAAHIIAMAATASKMSNLDVSYGVEQVTDALKTGSLANLEHLNLIKTGDPALKQRLSLLQKFTGIMSPAAVAQEKYNIILSALTNKTKDFMFSQIDLSDILIKATSSFKMLGGTIGSFLGRALGDVVMKFMDLVDHMTIFFERVKKN